MLRFKFNCENTRRLRSAFSERFGGKVARRLNPMVFAMH